MSIEKEELPDIKEVVKEVVPQKRGRGRPKMSDEQRYQRDKHRHETNALRNKKLDELIERDRNEKEQIKNDTEEIRFIKKRKPTKQPVVIEEDSSSDDEPPRPSFRFI